MENCVSRANKRNYRLWGSGELHGCRSEDPRHYGGSGGAAHFSFHGHTGTYILDRPVVRAAADNRAPVFLIETTAPLTLEIHNRSEEHTSELQSLMRISYAVFCLKKKKNKNRH